MSTLKVISIVILFIALGVVGAVVYGLKTLVTHTQGMKIEKYKEPQKALLIVDMQEDYTGKTAKDPFPYKDSDKLVTNVNNLINEAVKKDIAVIYIKQEFDGFFARTLSRIVSRGTVFKETPGSEIDGRISMVSNNIFSKSIGDGFSNKKLESFLVENQVDEIYLAGLDAAGCVYSTAKGGLNRGYQVTIIKDSIATRFGQLDSHLTKFKQDGIALITSKDFSAIEGD